MADSKCGLFWYKTQLRLQLLEKKKKKVINIVYGLICVSDSSYLEMVRNKTMR